MLGMISFLTRNIPDKESWIRAEVETGRFSHHNLLLNEWIERMLQIEQDYNLTILDKVAKDFIKTTPYQ